MSVDGSDISGLPHALSDAATVAERMAVKRVAGFLDYDVAVTPIVDRPEDALSPRGCAKWRVGWPAAAPRAS